MREPPAPRVTIGWEPVPDPVGNPSEALCLCCGGAEYWGWTPEELLEKLKSLQTRLSLEGMGRGATLPPAQEALPPGDSPAAREKAMAAMVKARKRFAGETRS